MRVRKLVVAMTMAFAAVFCHAGDSAPFVLDNVTSPSGETVVLPWNAEWIGGDANATVVITDNGIEVKRATGSGEFTLNISCGNHQFEYSTFIGGVKQRQARRLPALDSAHHRQGRPQRLLHNQSQMIARHPYFIMESRLLGGSLGQQASCSLRRSTRYKRISRVES